MKQHFDDLLADLLFALRNLRRRPALTAFALLSLALGIGANTAVFTLVHAFFLQSLGLTEPERLVAVFSTYRDGSGATANYLPLSVPDANDLAVAGTSAITGLAVQAPLSVSLAGDGPATRVFALAVSPQYGAVLGVRPALGRLFSAEEGQLGTSPGVVVLADGLWRRRFGADRGILGRTIAINRRPLTVVGVMPPGFKGTNRAGAVDLWVPLPLFQTLASPEYASQLPRRDGRVVYGVARLAPGVELGTAQAALATAAEGLLRAYPEENEGTGVNLVPLTSFYTQPERRGTQLRARTVMASAVAVVLAIACLNVASLLLVRASERGREIAVRVALGAQRSRLVRQMLTESALLGLLGGLAGLLVAFWGVRFLWSLRPPIFAANSLDLGLKAPVLLFTLAVALLTGLLFGLVPALRSSKARLVSTLRSDAAEPAAGGRRFTLRHWLVTGQLALCLASLVSAGLLVRSLGQFGKLDPGFNTSRVVVAALDLRSAGLDEEAGRELVRRAGERLRSLPGVAAAGWASVRLFTGHEFLSEVAAVGALTGKGGALLVRSNNFSAGAFEALEIALRAGRTFGADDRRGGKPVAVINEALARKLWPGGDAVGRTFTLDNEEQPLEVVGVVEDTQAVSLQTPPEPYLYLPSEQRYTSGITFYVRAQGEPEDLAAAVRSELAGLDAQLPLQSLETMPQLIAASLWAARLGAGVFTFFALLALVLAGVGVYGVMAASVDQRRGEIGMRMALGAERRTILLQVLKEAALLVVAGAALGLFAAWFAARAVGSLLYGIPASDPVTWLAVTGFLAAVALLASLLPAGRAASQSPLAAIRGH